MDHAERAAMREANPPVVDGAHSAHAYFDWRWKGCGFGQFSFHYDHETEKWSCSNEVMGPEASRKLLHAFADFVADNLAPVILEQDKRD